MKKRINPYIIPGTCMILVLLVAISIFYHNANAGKTDPQITAQAAKDIALSDAGQKKEEVTFTKTKLDRESPAPVYEIEFYTDEKEYEYEINAQTGSVRDKECTVHQTTKALQTASGSDAGTESDTDANSDNSKTNLQDPEKPATQDGDQDKTNTKNPDSANNSDQTKTKNAKEDNQTGSENKNQNQKNTENTGVIGVKKAQKIALKAAGLQRKQVTFTKSKLETDDGKNVYEIEFIKDGKEYDYNIDAYNGKILESSIDIEDEITERKSNQNDKDDDDDDDKDDRDDDRDDDDGDGKDDDDDGDDDRDDDSDDDDD